MKRQVTQEELDAVYAALTPKLAAVSPQEAPEAVEAAAGAPKTGGPSDRPDLIGIHIGQDRTNILFLTSKLAVARHTPLNAGWESLERLIAELTRMLEKHRQLKLPIYFTLSGKPSHFVIAKVPRLARAQLLKALKVQLKHSSNADWDDVEYLPLPGAKKGDTQVEYLASGLDKRVMEKIFRSLRKHKLRVVAWDADLLCYSRAANFLWQKQRLEGTTRFLVLLDWDHCHLMIQSADGRLIAPRLPIGINSFLEHLLHTREATLPRAEDEKDWRILGANPVEVRERKALANQAIHDVYVPLGQQIKTQLFAGCNEHGVPLPTHFAVASVGANLFQLVESLSADLGLEPIPIEESVPTEAVAALGAATWEKSDLKLNFLPRGQREALRVLKELMQSVRNRASAKKSGEKRSFSLPSFGSTGANVGLVVGALVLALIIAYPIWDRMNVSKQLDAKRRELASLAPLKERIAKSKEREALNDRKSAMVKVIEARRPDMSRALHELVSVMPAEIQLQSLSFKDAALDLKGLSRNALAVQNFLKEALDLKLLKEPTPVGIKRDKDTIEFEITFKFKSQS